MMTFRDTISFLQRRYKYDTHTAFFFRIIRLVLIRLFYIPRNIKTRALTKLKKYPLVPVLYFNMRVDKDDPGISSDLYLDKVREEYITRELVKHIEPGMTCYDIGANIGYYVVQESVLAGPAGQVHAIEPIPHNYYLLKTNVLQNNLQNTQLYNLAIGNSNREDRINVSPMSNMCSMVKKQGYRSYVDSLPVRVMMLDTFIANKQYPDFVRMDVEGYELEILQGMSSILAEQRPLKLFIEVHCDILMGKMVQFADILERAGFEIAVATFEAHMAVKNTFAMPLLRYCDKKIGAQTGIVPLKLRDLRNREFRMGQVYVRL